MGVLHQNVSKVAAEGMSSAEEAKWRDWDEDPELLCNPLDSLQALKAKQEAEIREQQQAILEVQRPLSMDAAAQVIKAAAAFEHHPATIAANLSFNVGRF